MATRASLTLADKKGDFWTIYVHYDGYITGGLGDALKAMKPKEIIQIIKDGDHSYINSFRDRSSYVSQGEDYESNKARKYFSLTSMVLDMAQEYNYIFDERTRDITVFKDKHYKQAYSLLEFNSEPNLQEKIKKFITEETVQEAKTKVQESDFVVGGQILGDAVALITRYRDTIKGLKLDLPKSQDHLAKELYRLNDLAVSSRKGEAPDTDLARFPRIKPASRDLVQQYTSILTLLYQMSGNPINRMPVFKQLELFVQSVSKLVSDDLEENSCKVESSLEEDIKMNLKERFYLNPKAIKMIQDDIVDLTEIYGDLFKVGEVIGSVLVDLIRDLQKDGSLGPGSNNISRLINGMKNTL